MSRGAPRFSFLGANYALKELDESGIQASHFARKSLHQKRFIFNHTFGRGAGKSLKCRIALASMLNSPRFCQRYPGLVEKMTTLPWPTASSRIAGRPRVSATPRISP